MFYLPEIDSSLQFDIPLVTIVFFNYTYVNVYRQQDVWFGGRFIDAELHNRVFMKLADAIGMQGYRVESADELKTTLEQAFEARKPCLIEVPVGEMPTPWKFILMENVRD